MILGISGTMSFQMKYIENQYDMPAFKISLYLGLGMLGTVVLGVFMGGLLITRFKLGLRGMFRVTVAGEFVALACATAFMFLGCPNHQVVGFNQDVGNVTDAGCHCFSQAMLVVCGEDGRNYLSPCIAGCAQSDGLSFSQCAYVGGLGTAVPGFCQDCDLFPYFMTIVTLMALAMLITFTPHTLMIARLVPLSDQPNVTALTSVVLTVGMLVGPIIFGHIYDLTCSLWSPMSGQCVVPDKEALRHIFIASDIGLRAAGFVLLVIAAIMVHCDKGVLEHDVAFDTSITVTNFSRKLSQAPSRSGEEDGEGGAKEGQSQPARKSKRAMGVSDPNGRVWRKSLAYLGGDGYDGWDLDSEAGGMGEPGRKSSYPVPDVRGVTFGKVNPNGSVVTNHADNNKQPDHEASDEYANIEPQPESDVSIPIDIVRGYADLISPSDTASSSDEDNRQSMQEMPDHSEHDNNGCIHDNICNQANSVKDGGDSVDETLQDNNNSVKEKQAGNKAEEIDISEDDIGAMFDIDDK